MDVTEDVRYLNRTFCELALVDLADALADGAIVDPGVELNRATLELARGYGLGELAETVNCSIMDGFTS